MIITIQNENLKVTIEDPDVIDIFQVRELLVGVLVAVGFHPDTVKEIFPEEI